MSSQENTSRRSRSRTHSHADRNTRERSRVSNVSIQATLGSIQDSMTALHISNPPPERDHPPSYPNSLNNSSPANHPPRADSTTQSVAHPYTTGSKATDKTQWMPGHRQTRSNVGNDINNSHIPTLASRNIGQLPSAGRSGHGNQGGGSGSLEKAQVTRLEYVPSASFESIHISTGPVHQEPVPNSRVEVTQARGEMRSLYSSFFSKLSPRGFKQPHLYYTDFESTMLSKELSNKSHGYYLEYMKCEILEQSSHIPLFRPSFVTRIMPGDVGRFQADGSFQSLFNMYLTAQENSMRFNQDPPEGFKPFEVPISVGLEKRNENFLTTGAPSGPEYFKEFSNSLEWTGQAYQFKILPSLSNAVSALILTSSKYRIYSLRSLSKVEEYFESQLKIWYNGEFPNLKKKDRNGRLVLVKGTYVTDGAVGLLHYSRDKAREVTPDDVITGTFGRKLSTTTTSDVGGQVHKYVWNITGPGSSQANLKRTMLEPAEHHGNAICFGIAALSLWEK